MLRRMPMGRAPFQSALAFGIGFGVVEALLLGMASLGTSLSMMSMPRGAAGRAGSVCPQQHPAGQPGARLRAAVHRDGAYLFQCRHLLRHRPPQIRLDVAGLSLYKTLIDCWPPMCSQASPAT